MKILNKYILSSIIKTLFFTILLTSLILLNVDIFSNFDSYVQNSVSLSNIILITLMYLPQAIIIVLPPATLFTITFFLSQLYTNNEIIAFLSSGISIRQIFKPILIFMFIFSFIIFLFNENFVLQSKIDYENLKNEVLNINNELDNSNIGLIDSLNNNVIYANRYVENNKSLRDVIVLQKDEKNQVKTRIDAKTAVWNNEKNDWILNDVYILEMNNNDVVSIKSYQNYENETINLDYNMFRNLSADLQTMFLPTALNYLNIQKQVNIRLWYENMSDFLDRLLAPFAALIMTIIALSIDYKGRKNVFLFSVFNSIILAIVYYVSKMVFQLISKQAIMSPFVASIIPYVIIIFASFILNRLKQFSEQHYS